MVTGRLPVTSAHQIYTYMTLPGVSLSLGLPSFAHSIVLDRILIIAKAKLVPVVVAIFFCMR